MLQIPDVTQDETLLPYDAYQIRLVVTIGAEQYYRWVQRGCTPQAGALFTLVHFGDSSRIGLDAKVCTVEHHSVRTASAFFEIRGEPDRRALLVEHDEWEAM